jgi:hypothetical protein
MQQVRKFKNWCDDNFLNLYVKKTKETVIDFRKDATYVPDLLINDQTVERVSEYKYLGTILDDKLNFGANTEAIHTKCQSRLYCLQKLRSLGVKKSVLCNF